MKKIICAAAVFSLLVSSLTACGRVESRREDEDDYDVYTLSSEASTDTTTSTTLTPEQRSSMSVASSVNAIAKAKAEATRAAMSKAAAKGTQLYSFSAEGKTEASSGKTRVGTSSASSKQDTSSKGRYEVSTTEIKHFIGNIRKAWVIGQKDFPGLYVQIGRIELDKTVTQSFNSGVSGSVKYPQTVTYHPVCSVAKIVCDSPSRLKMSASDGCYNTERIAESVNACIAVNGRTSYSQSNAAVVRNGEIFKSYTGAAGKAGMRLVMYSNGTWKFVKGFDNDTAKNEIAKGALTSTTFQDVTIQNSRFVSTLSDSTYKNRTYLGQIDSKTYVLMTTEFMPIRDAAAVMLAYGVKTAVQINGGNCSQMYVRNIGNTTGSQSPSIKSLDKVGYLESEWIYSKGLSNSMGGPCSHETDIIYFK